MTPEHLPGHALFIKWGRFQAGAIGVPAMALLSIFLLVGALWWFVR